MKLLVLTPESTLLEADDLLRVRIPLMDGSSIGIHPGHYPLLAETRTGRIEFGQKVYTDSISVRAGISRVEADQVTIYTSGLEGEQDQSHSDQPTRRDQLAEELEKRLEEEF